MNWDETLEEIYKILESHNRSGVTLEPDTDLAADLQIDSVESMDIIMEIEDRFGIDIPLNSLGDVRKIRNIVELVHERADEH